MTLIQFFRLAGRYFPLMLLCAAIAAGTTYLNTKKEKKEYETFSIINTGLVTGYNIEKSNGGRIDFGYANNEIENILSLFRSRETHKAVALHLLAAALFLDAPDEDILGNEGFMELQQLLPADIRQNIVVKGDTARTIAKLDEWHNKHGKNPVKSLFESNNELFGLAHLSNIVVKRDGNTDMIRIAYTTTDPAICKNTLRLLTDIAIYKHKQVKEGQSTSVLDFFEKATQESATELTGKEDDLLNFMVGNKIINYYEQTRYIAAKKEDLDELYFKELMKLAAADSSRRNLELKLGEKVNLPEINRSLLSQREQLAGINGRLAALEIGSLTDSLTEANQKPANAASSAALQKQADELKKGLRQNTDAIFAVNRTSEGLETQNLLGRWLNEWLDVEQTLARIEVLRNRKTEFDLIYSRFAPWGSKLKRIEREIEVAEGAYLENLHSFNQARLHKHNMLMSTNLRVIDAPFFPEKAKPSKRVLLVVVSFLAGFIMVLGAALALEFLDRTLHNPERAAETTELELVTAFPHLPKNWENNPQFDYSFLVRRAAGQWLQHLKLSLREQGIVNRPARIALLSTREGEGKSQVTSIIIEQLRAAGERVLWLRPSEAGIMPSVHTDDHFYAVNHTFFEKKSESDILGEPLDLSTFTYVFTEMPSILANTYPADYLAQVDLGFFVAHANHIWNQADMRALGTLHRVLARPTSLILNSVRPDDLENAIGEVPKKRSAMRIWMKKLATLNFSNNSQNLKY